MSDNSVCVCITRGEKMKIFQNSPFQRVCVDIIDDLCLCVRITNSVSMCGVSSSVTEIIFGEIFKIVAKKSKITIFKEFLIFSLKRSEK